MKTRALYLMLSLALISSSCISFTTLSSNQAKEVDTKIEKVFVLMDNPGSTRFFKFFQKHFLRELLNARVTTTIFDKTLISMESDAEIQSQIDRYAPTHLIRVKQESSNSAFVDFAGAGYANEVRTGGLYLIEIIQNNNQKVIWKGLLNTDEYMTTVAAAEKSARKVVKDLVKRELIVL